MSNIGGLGISNPTFNPFTEVGETGQTNRPNNDPNLVVSHTDGSSGLQFQGGIVLENPTVGPEDIPLTEFQQGIDSLNGAGSTVVLTASSVFVANQAAFAFAEALLGGGEAFIAENRDTVIYVANEIEEAAAEASTRIADMLASGNYPDYTDFLKEMLRVSQELKELASTAKHAAIEASYENVLAQAEKMMVAAQKNYDAAIEEVKAQRAEATASIVSGVFSVVFGIVGAATSLGQLGSTIGTGFGQIADGIGKHVSASHKQTAAGYRFEADSANVDKTRLEAIAKLIQGNEQTADEIKETAKALRDAILKLYQDFISSQAQIIQRSNI